MNQIASFSRFLPYFTAGVVVKGFGRGSKELGIPTANFAEDTVEKLPAEFPCGVYYGWAQVGVNGAVHKMVMSIGWNPFYKNKMKSMETHIMHTFEEDFYGDLLKIVILDYIRDEKAFQSKDELVDAIRDDIDKAISALDEPRHATFATHQFFQSNFSNSPMFKL